MKRVNKIFVIFVVCVFVTFNFIKTCIDHYYIPRVIEDRARSLAKLQYGGKGKGMIWKDSVEFDEWDYHYLRYGTMKTKDD